LCGELRQDSQAPPGQSRARVCRVGFLYRFTAPEIAVANRANVGGSAPRPGRQSRYPAQAGRQLGDDLQRPGCLAPGALRAVFLSREVSMFQNAFVSITPA